MTITLDRSDAASLQHAAATLRWLLAKTACGWSHPQLDPDDCAKWQERLGVINNDARAQLKTAETAVIQMSEADALLLRRFIVLVKQVDSGGFDQLVLQLSQIAFSIDPPRLRRLQRNRPSGLAEP